MGLKYASVRQPYVVVMAPALTELSQPQELSNSGALSSPISLLTLKDSVEDNSNYKSKCTSPLKLVKRVGMNGDFENNTEQKPELLTSTNLCDDSEESLNKTINKVLDKESDYSLLQIGGFMMNNSYLGSGDDGTNMGQQKSGSNLDSYSNALKMDLFKGLGSTTLPQSDLCGGGDLGQNVEEIMQVIKNMESKQNNIEENLVNVGNDIAGTLSTFEREFFNDVDMMNICVDDNLADTSLALVSKDTVIIEKVDEARERQFKIERKYEWLRRRLRKIQARAMGRHASEEITKFLQRLGNVVDDNSSINNATDIICKKDNKKEVFNQVFISSFMKRLLKSSKQAPQQPILACKYFGSGRPTLDTNSSRNCLAGPSGTILPKLNSDMCKEMKNVFGQFRFQLKVVENGLDSDVTASSSGGESCDEMQNFNNPQQQSLSISKRSAWKWAQDRAGIASRWCWLQTQISDLEYRIRTVKKTNLEIRANKGSVVLAGENPPMLCDNVVLNGYHGSLPGTKSDQEIVPDSCCRTRPIIRSSFRKRKLYRPTSNELITEKAAKLSTMQCGCHPPMPSCIMCNGETNPTLPRPDNDLLSLNERIALLDPAFHPVLSLPCDISQSLHFEALMKTCEWQLKSHRLQMKSAMTRIIEPAPTDEHVVKSVEPKQPQQRRRYIKRSIATALTDKIKKKLAKAKRDQNTLEMLKSRRRIGSLKVPDEQSRFGDTRDEETEPTSTFTEMSSVSRPSPIASPSHSHHFTKERETRRKRENSFDIDNIVIPYSVAASTRPEILHYKEILTPKWRVVEPEPEVKNNGLIRRMSTDDSDVEDLSEEALVSRHERSELLEKKKFSTYLKLPNSMARVRGPRRADSRAESSGANTPDPMSPGGADSPMTSPPATPQPSDMECTNRKRTVSSRCVSPVDVPQDEVPPYDSRTYPLPDEAYEKMLRIMPPGHPFKALSSDHNHDERDSECESRPLTPLSDSTESADTIIDEDPNDPEWTVSKLSLERVPFKR